MEKITFTPDGADGEAVDFYVLEQTRIGGILKRKELQTEVVNFLILGKALSLDIVSSARNVRLSDKLAHKFFSMFKS